MGVDLSELRSRPLVFVDDLAAPVLSDGDRHHFERVLRVRLGDPVTLGDGAGSWRPARFGPEPEPTDEIATEPPPPDPITVAFTPVKGERSESIVRRLTELGVDRIVPLECRRSVVRWDGAKAAKQQAKLIVAAREACLQSRRLHLPAVGPLTAIESFVADVDPSEVVIADPDGGPVEVGHRTIAIGPEGGFTDDERGLAPLVRLPGHILRAETAAVVAAAALATRRLSGGASTTGSG